MSSSQDPFALNRERVEGLRTARLAAVLEASSDAFYDVDLTTQTITWSLGMALMFGHDPQKLGERLDAWQSLIHPDDAAEVVESGRAFLPSGAPSWTASFRFRRADGGYAFVRVRSILVRDGGRPLHIVGALTDVSELQQREDELHEVAEDLAHELQAERQERARADLLMRSARAEVLCDWDMRTGRITYSPNAEQLLGHPPQELADVPSFMRYTDPEVGPRQLEQMQRAIASGAISYTSPPFRFRRADGEEVMLATHGYVLRDGAGAPVRAVASLFLIPPDGASTVAAPVITGRQRRILDMVRQGLTNKEIATDLGVSEQAAKAQVRKLMRRFGVANRAALAAAKVS